MSQEMQETLKTRKNKEMDLPWSLQKELQPSRHPDFTLRPNVHVLQN